MKHIITLIAAIFVAFTINLVAANPGDPIQQALDALKADKHVSKEDQAALVAAVEALKRPSPQVTGDDLRIICNRIEANSTRYSVKGNNLTTREKTELVEKTQNAHGAAVVALQGKPVSGDRKEHIEYLLRVLGHTKLNADAKVKYADDAVGYYLLGIRALAGASASATATPPANPPSAPAQQNPPPAPAKEPVATVTQQPPAPPAPEPPAPKKPITRTPPVAPNVTQ